MHITTLFIWFFLYSILGWAYETLYCTMTTRKWDNRGMLIGPYCPIYGVGAVLDVLICEALPSRGMVFFVCMAGSAVLEYATSYTTEWLFHAVWWDYSKLPLNLNGRICLPCSIGFGVAGLVVLYGIHPYMAHITGWIPLYWQEAVALLFMAIFATDCALTADSLIALNVKLEATINAIDSHISERYDAFVKNTRQNLAGELGALRIMMSMEEFRERRMREELKNTLTTMTWRQSRTLRSAVAFRKERYHELGKRMKEGLTRHKDV